MANLFEEFIEDRKEDLEEKKDVVEQLVENGKDFLQDGADVVSAVFSKDENVKEEFDELVANGKENIKETIQEIKEVTAGNKPEIVEMVQQGSAPSPNPNDLKKMMEELKKKMQQALNDPKKFFESLKEACEQIGNVNVFDIYKLKDINKNVNEFTDSQNIFSNLVNNKPQEQIFDFVKQTLDKVDDFTNGNFGEMFSEQNLKEVMDNVMSGNTKGLGYDVGHTLAQQVDMFKQEQDKLKTPIKDTKTKDGNER